MSTGLAEYSLAGAMLTCLVVMLAAIAYPQTKNAGLLRCARWGLALIAGLLAVSSWGLLTALINDDFTLAYVREHSEKTLAIQYKVAAFWAGQEGSLLFWALALGVMGMIMAWRGRRKNDAAEAITLAIMAGVTGFFTCVMLFAGNPFELATTRVANGEGLNPMLQNLAMVAHPPLLFLGYAGFTAPFALLAGALLAGRKDGAWLDEARPWMVYSWIMLTIGIVLGAQWAYVELGWGGYWAWDPVENASILPWFTGTALLHCTILQKRSGIFKKWTAWLALASFFLCIFGTYLTRSGVIQSVHSFGESLIGTFFLAFLGMIALAGPCIILVRGQLLKADHTIDGLLSREGTFLLANVLLSIMTLVTLVGTIFPILSSWFGGTPITVKASFYNNVILPMALLLAAVMATGPIIGSGAGAGARATRKLAGMVVAGCAVALALFITGFVSLWAMMVGAVIGAIVTAVVIDVATAIWPKPGANMLQSLGQALALRPRHWGAQVAHLGLAAIVAGVAGSSIYGATQHVHLDVGAAKRVGDYTLTLQRLQESRQTTYTALTATVQVRDTNGKTFQLQPESRAYDSEEGRISTEVAIRFSLGRDVYLTLDAADPGNNSEAITTIINPLVTWIWIGGALLALGGLVCLIPARRQKVIPEPQATDPEKASKAHGSKRHNSRKAHAARATYVSGSAK